MLTRQTITILGPHPSGKQMLNCLASSNYHLLICDEDMNRAEELVEEIRKTQGNCDVEAMQCCVDAAWEADIIMLTMSFDEQQTMAERIRDVVCRKILVSLVPNGGDASKQLTALETILPYSGIVTLFIKEEHVDNLGCRDFARSFMAMGKDAASVSEVYNILDTASAHLSLR